MQERILKTHSLLRYIDMTMEVDGSRLYDMSMTKVVYTYTVYFIITVLKRTLNIRA
jgi:hypothetical protein